MDQPSAPRHPGRPRQRIAIRTVLPALLAAGALAACASAPQPAPFIAAGTASIEAARASGAAELAPVPLDNARAKLQQAQALAQAGNHEDAVRLAQQADVDAQLARARAGAERSRRSAAEIEAGLQVLQDELARRQAPTGPSPQPVPPQPQPPRLPQ
jgi:Domain of unknown function (DUF4398)